jgi:hypothetical protein
MASQMRTASQVLLTDARKNNVRRQQKPNPVHFRVGCQLSTIDHGKGKNKESDEFRGHDYALRHTHAVTQWCVVPMGRTRIAKGVISPRKLTQEVSVAYSADDEMPVRLVPSCAVQSQNKYNEAYRNRQLNCELMA